VDSTEGEVAPKNPIRGIFVGCCARATTEDATNKVYSATAVIFLLFIIRLTPAALRLTEYTIASLHLMTLSARASTFGGIVRPICFAVFKLITSSNFVGRSTDRSAGFAPLRILST